MKTSVSTAETTANAAPAPVSPARRSATKRAKKTARPTVPPARKGSKGARMLALLQKPSGATLKTLMKATGWQAHSVRAFVSAYVGKRLGLPVKSVERNGQRFYTITK
jgi:hypothetical protein